MNKAIKMTIENKLVLERRDMNVYHHSTRSAHMISFGNSITLPFRSTIEDDYLHISIVSGPGRLECKSVVNLPSWVDFEFSSEGNLIASHSGGRTLLKIPPGLPQWQLKLTRSASAAVNQSSSRVTVGDEHSEY